MKKVKIVDDYYSGMVGSYMRGERQKSLEIAKKLLADNMQMELIIKYTGLTKEQINALK